MALVRYVGPFQDVSIPYGEFGWIEAKRGEPVEVPDEIVAGLLDQPDNWRRVKAARAKKENTDG